LNKEVIKKEIISLRKNDPWPLGLQVINKRRYSTLKTGMIILLELVNNPQGCSLAHLMEKTGKARKTIWRLITVLDDIGIPIYEEREHIKIYYKISRDWANDFKRKTSKESLLTH
jgi:biotin operon repressor